MKIRKKITIKNLFKLCNCDNNLFYYSQKPKYDIKVNTPAGYKKINYCIKKNNLLTVRVNINKKEIIGATTHLIKYNNIWRTLESFKHKQYIGKNNLYDISVDSPHEFYTTNGIIHHNTSIAHAICQDLKADYLYYNTSKDNSIDILRNNITKFAVSKSLDGKQKIVILDELGNHAISGLQDGLRADLELFHNTCRFIITTNYINRIIDPLKSRCEVIDFNFTEKEIVDEMKPKIIKRLKLILGNEKIEFEEEAIIKIVDKYYPDIRYMIKIF
jgi:DNA polymerase III delta prime subunit